MELILQNYTKKQYRSIKENVELLHKTFDSEAIHDIRLAVKKLRAVASLIQVLLPNSSKNAILMEPLIPLYKSIGLIRDIEIKKKMLQSYQLQTGIQIHGLSSSLHEELIKAEAKAYKTIKKVEIKGKKLFINRIEKIVRTHSKQSILDSVNAESVRIIAEIARLTIQGNVSEELYHEIRKSFKTITYLYQLLKKDLNKNKFILQPEWCKPIELLLGDWHDRVVLETYCKQLQPTLEQEEAGKVVELIHLLENEKSALLKQFSAKYYLLQQELDEHL